MLLLVVLLLVMVARQGLPVEGRLAATTRGRAAGVRRAPRRAPAGRRLARRALAATGRARRRTGDPERLVLLGILVEVELEVVAVLVLRGVTVGLRGGDQLRDADHRQDLGSALGRVVAPGGG